MAFRNIGHKFRYHMHEDMRKRAFLYEYPLKQPTFIRLSRLAAITRRLRHLYHGWQNAIAKTLRSNRLSENDMLCRAYRQGAAHASVSNIFPVKHSLVKKLYIYPVKILFTNLLFPVQRCPRSRDILFLA